MGGATPFEFRCVYGPVPSWRLGVSLGVDPLGGERKICNYDCVYCQLGPTRSLVTQRGVWVEAAELENELRRFPRRAGVDVVSFSGRGEPTLAANLGELIKTARTATEKPVALITNAFLINDPEVAADMTEADIVMAKLDAVDTDVFQEVDQPAFRTDPQEIIRGLIRFRRMFKGCLNLQMMFIEENKHQAPLLAEAARRIGADGVEINTPTRPCGRKPLKTEALRAIKETFRDVPCVSVDERTPPEVVPWDFQAATRRHGRYDRSRNVLDGNAFDRCEDEHTQR